MTPCRAFCSGSSPKLFRIACALAACSAVVAPWTSPAAARAVQRAALGARLSGAPLNETTAHPSNRFCIVT